MQLFNASGLALCCAVLLGLSSAPVVGANESSSPKLKIHWADNYLTVRGDFPGGELSVLYLEAYCRAGSTDRDWNETVIPHKSRLVESRDDEQVLVVRDELADGVTVEHTITAGTDEIDFRVVAHNPTDTASQAHWAQPCIRVGAFTSAPSTDARALVPQYARQCFVFLDGKLALLPTTPWADQARYTPGQVYCPAHVDRRDVNPRPLSGLVPSNGLMGCFSADKRKIMAVAWEPYQELFLGVITCLHSDFRLGGLEPGETKKVRGKIYIVDADVPALVRRYEKDFPEHVRPRSGEQ